MTDVRELGELFEEVAWNVQLAENFEDLFNKCDYHSIKITKRVDEDTTDSFYKIEVVRREGEDPMEFDEEPFVNICIGRALEELKK